MDEEVVRAMRMAAAAEHASRTQEGQAAPQMAAALARVASQDILTEEASAQELSEASGRVAPDSPGGGRGSEPEQAIPAEVAAEVGLRRSEPGEMRLT